MPRRKAQTSADSLSIVPVGEIERQILLIRGQRIILAADLARMYAVPVKRLNEQVKRNAERFPDDFVFQLTQSEARELLRSQIATLDDSASKARSATTAGRGRHLKYLPYAFTEHGALMAANLLRSERAAKVSVYVVRAFIKLREFLSTHRELAAKLGELESRLQDHDEKIISLINAIRALMHEPKPRPKPPIGYYTEEKRSRRGR